MGFPRSTPRLTDLDLELPGNLFPHLSKVARRRDTDDMKPDDSKSSAGERPSYPPGRQPYDKLVGMRVGALVGGLIGGLGAFLLGGVFAWLIAIGAVLGGVIGHRMGES